MLNYDELLKKPFNFMGRVLTYAEAREWKHIKVYKESDHFDRILVQDTEGNLYLYEFYEYVNFGGSDEIYNTFVLVKDEKDADELNNEKDIRRKNSFRLGANFEITVM